MITKDRFQELTQLAIESRLTKLEVECISEIGNFILEMESLKNKKAFSCEESCDISWEKNR